MYLNQINGRTDTPVKGGVLVESQLYLPSLRQGVTRGMMWMGVSGKRKASPGRALSRPEEMKDCSLVMKIMYSETENIIAKRFSGKKDLSDPAYRMTLICSTDSPCGGGDQRQRRHERWRRALSTWPMDILSGAWGR